MVGVGSGDRYAVENVADAAATGGDGMAGDDEYGSSVDDVGSDLMMRVDGCGLI